MPRAVMVLCAAMLVVPVTATAQFLEYVYIGTMQDWEEALQTQRIVPMTPTEWDDYMTMWQASRVGDPYPESEFVPCEPDTGGLYVWPGEEDSDYPRGAGLVMYWESGGGGGTNCCECVRSNPPETGCIDGPIDELICMDEQIVGGWDFCMFQPEAICGPGDACEPLQFGSASYSSAFKFAIGGGEPFLQPLVNMANKIISVTVTAPQFDMNGNQIMQVSLGIQDGNGLIMAYFWNVGPGGAIPWGVPMQITVNTSIPGAAGANPPAAGFMMAPGFNLAQSQFIIVDENGQWIGGGTPIPPPGQPSGMWNYWHNLSIGPAGGGGGPQLGGPVSFSVNGPVDPQFDGLPTPAPPNAIFLQPWMPPPTPVGAGPFPHMRTVIQVPKARGIATGRIGDVNDYYLLGGAALTLPDAEIFQSEPDQSPAGAPAGTNNQILQAVTLGLAPDFSNVNAYTFGEDFFNGDEDPIPGDEPVEEVPWYDRENYGSFMEPVVGGGGLPIMFYFSVDTWAIGLFGTAVRSEATLGGALSLPAGPAGSADRYGGAPPPALGPWFSNGEAAGDVFHAAPINIPGMNFLAHDEFLLALLAPYNPAVPGGYPPANMEDDLDALENVGTNTLDDGTAVEPGNTHDRVAPTAGVIGGFHPPDLGDPTNPNHDAVNGNPIIFSVDRGTYALLGSAVNAQVMNGNEGASGDLFIAVTMPAWHAFPGMTTNMLLIDEGQLGLMPHDDLDAVIVKLLIGPGELHVRIEDAALNFEPDMESVGLGFTIPLLAAGEVVVGFSVDNSSIGLLGSAVDFECRVDGLGLPGGSGVMEQGGDIFFSDLVPPPFGGGMDQGTMIPFGQNYLWFEEWTIGLDSGNWTLAAVSGDLSDSPDELNSLDSLFFEEQEPGPENDDCIDATPVGDVVGLPFDTTTATFDGGGMCMSGPNIWYAYTASCTGSATVSLCGSGYDTKLAVYDGSSCDPLDPEIECNDDFCGLQSQVSFSATAGNTYLVEVGGFASEAGPGLLSIACNAWYFDEAGVAGWGQTFTPPKWERMDAGPLPDCAINDLDPQNPYYAGSYPITYDYSGYRFFAKIWLQNNWQDMSDPLTVELRKGGWMDEGTLLSTATAYVTNFGPVGTSGRSYLFDFGTIASLVLNNESLVLKISYVDDGGNAHIYWDGEECPSALHAVPPGVPGLDSVVCEPQDGIPDMHPPFYWYDVTPGAFGRCDFHVRVEDPIAANYSSPSLPNAATWQFAVHQVGTEWWASWWDADCVNAIFNTFRFRFTNLNPSTWGHWTTTVGASSNPHFEVIDFAGHHFAEVDGWGYRVHVPTPPEPPEMDFGDALETFWMISTTLANNGARHLIVPGVQLGALIDAEPDGQPTAQADGDDLNNLDDEDGVTFTSQLIPGQSATVAVEASTAGFLSGWADYNHDGVWGDTVEKIFFGQALAPGTNNLNYIVPGSAVIGNTYFRFRFTTTGTLSYQGLAQDGEVEDYYTYVGSQLLQACCLPDGSCAELVYDDCVAQGGDPQGPQMNDCDLVQCRPIKWAQPPTFNPQSPHPECFWGWDEVSMYDGIIYPLMADDFLCQDPRPITDIHWWGSYMGWDGIDPPPDAPVLFHIGIWTDVPAGMDPPYSHPGMMIWEWMVPHEMLNERPVACDFHPDPAPPYFMAAPEGCFKYDFIIPQAEWFYQEQPDTVYWLSISAIHPNPFTENPWGWKTREHYFNDNAVRIMNPLSPTIGSEFIVGEPIPHAENWDLAFVLTTTECDDHLDCEDGDPCTYDYCNPAGGECEFPPRLWGDINGDGAANIVDVICTARVVFQGATECAGVILDPNQVDVGPPETCGDGLLNIIDLIICARAAFQGTPDLCCGP